MLISRRENAAHNLGSEWRFNTATLMATKPNGDVRQFVVVGEDARWAQKLSGHVFDAGAETEE